jgi:hypothetical protein
VDEDGGEMVHVKLDIPIEMTNTGKTIDLKCLDDCGFNMDSIQIYLTNFYSLLGKYPIEVWPEPPAAGPPITDSISLIPDIQIATQQLTKEIVKDGVVVLFGESSKIIEAAAGPYKFSIPEYVHHRDSASLISYFRNTRDWDKPIVLESASGDFFSMVKNNDILSWVEPFRSSSINHLAGFLAMHATGHNAGIEHSIAVGEFRMIIWEIGYMSEANTIVCYYLGNEPLFGRCIAHEKGEAFNVHWIWTPSDPPIVNSLEELVEKSPEIFGDSRAFEALQLLIYIRYIE